MDLVTFLDGLDKMISAFGKANTVLTGKPKLSPIWGEATYSDVLDNKISFSMDPEFFIRKLMEIYYMSAAEEYIKHSDLHTN